MRMIENPVEALLRIAEMAADRFPYGADVSPQTFVRLCDLCEARAIPLGFTRHNEIEIAGVRIHSRPGVPAGKLWPREKPEEAPDARSSSPCNQASARSLGAGR